MKTAMIVLGFLITTSASAQTPPPIPATPIPDFNSYRPVETPTTMNGRDIRIGHDDLVDVSVFEIPELSSSGRVSAAGSLVLPYVGAIEAAGKTPLELGRAIEDMLRVKYVNDPHVTVFIREYASQPVSVIGAVKMPGIYQIKGEKLLLDVIAMAQGLTEVAGKEIHIIRRTTPPTPAAAPPSNERGTLPPTAGETNSDTPTIVIDAADLFQNGNASLNIAIYAGDVVDVLNAGSIFTVGEFQRPGESMLRFGRPVTVTQAVALGGGLTRDARRGHGTIIRPHADGTKEQIPVDVARVLDGSQPDLLLKPNDVLFVPSNKVKGGVNRALDSVLAIVVGRAIYRGF